MSAAGAAQLLDEVIERLQANAKRLEDILSKLEDGVKGVKQQMEKRQR